MMKMRVSIIGAGRNRNGIGEYIGKYFHAFGTEVTSVLGTTEKTSQEATVGLRKYGIIATPYGPVCVEWKIAREGNFRLYVTVPEQTTAEVFLPGTNSNKVKINGRPAAGYPEVKSAGLRNGRLVYHVKPGEYQFEL